MANKNANAGADDSADKNSDNKTGAETGNDSQSKDDQKSKGAKKSDKKSDDKSNDKSDDKESYKTFDSKQDFDDYVNKVVKARLAREKNKTDDSDDSDTDGDAKKAETENRSDNSKAFDSFMSGLGDVPYSKGKRLFKMYADDLELDENGKPLNLTEVIKEAKKDFPDWFKAKVSGDADAGKGNNSNGDDAADMNSLIRKKAGRI